MDTHSLQDPVEPIYDARIRGVGIIATRNGSRIHLHGGCWWAPCSEVPPMLMVAIPKEFEGAELVQSGGAFAISVVSCEQAEWNARFFQGHHHIGEYPSGTFLQATSGCPILAGAVAYFDCNVAYTLNLGDFVLAVGMVIAQGVLHPDRDNLTVNAIIASADPRGHADALLPFQGFDYPVDTLELAPNSQSSAALTLQAVYRLRHWGVFLVSIGHRGEQRMHLSTWSMQVSHIPPRIAVSLENSWEETGWLDADDTRVTLSMVAEDQAPWNQGLLLQQGPATAEAWIPTTGGSVRLDHAVGYFVCHVTEHCPVGNNQLALLEVEHAEWDRPTAINLEAVALRPGRGAMPR